MAIGVNHGLCSDINNGFIKRIDSCSNRYLKGIRCVGKTKPGCLEYIVACVINTVWLSLENMVMDGDWVYELHRFGTGRFQTVKYFIRNNRNGIWYLLYGFCYPFLLW